MVATLSTEQLTEKLIAVRRDIHRNPELSWEEVRTTDKICEFLDTVGLKHRRIPGITGVIADIPGPEGVAVVALRADIDALPVHEETGLEFSSRNDGKMHACGHDGHTCMLLGAAALLAGAKDLPAPVRLIFQPAEEKGNGAKRMVKEGVLEDVGMIFGGHIDRHFKPGTIAVTDGVVNASTDTFIIDIHGKDGHDSMPHESIDAVVVGSLLVTALQTLVSREINPAHPSVVTVGKFKAGTAANVIASRCQMEGTIRTQDEEVRNHLKKSLARISESVAQLHAVNIQCRITEGLAVLTNTPEAVLISRRAAANVVGEENVDAMRTANMGGEDFAFYIHEGVPGCYVRFGGLVDGCEYPAHSSRFVFDEKCLMVGARYYAEIARVAGKELASRK